MLIYAVTIFLSAVLIFQVQPMIAKAILPWFGGGAAVWTACMLFFQVLLLLGYGYAHWLTSRVSAKWQIIIQSVLVTTSLLLLPIVPDPHWQQPLSETPLINILAVLATSVGLPYFVLSTTTPLVQAWFAATHRTALPYRLFSVSNAASLIGLVAYPFALEPFVSTRQQLWIWSAVYALFAILCISTAIRSGFNMRSGVVTGEQPVGSKVLVAPFMQWLSFAACASVLLLSFTNFLSQDVAPVPFLWILPLALYLLSFVLCFGSDTWYRPRFFRFAVAPAFLAMGLLVSFQAHVSIIVIVSFATLLIACTFCHGELARLKPPAQQLTIFYLAISLGGALGGAAVAILAPIVYSSYSELPLSAVACVLLAVSTGYGGTAIHNNLAAAAVVVLATIFTVLPNRVDTNVLAARNFYGALRVSDAETSAGRVRQLLHGSTLHGVEIISAGGNLTPTTYYGTDSAVGRLLRVATSPRRVGVVGLGTGTLAAYAAPGDVFRFYEINPLVHQIASSRFHFLPRCRGRCDVVVGDARISLEGEPPQNFDVLALDAFSSDSIPVHLLTGQAFRTYLRHLKPGGVLAVHISNRYLDLAPVVASACEQMGLVVRIFVSPGKAADQTTTSVWAVVARDAELFSRPEWHNAEKPTRRVPAWTDDYSNLLHILRL